MIFELTAVHPYDFGPQPLNLLEIVLALAAAIHLAIQPREGP
jgi:hypothetical protein